MEARFPEVVEGPDGCLGPVTAGRETCLHPAKEAGRVQWCSVGHVSGLAGVTSVLTAGGSFWAGLPRFRCQPAQF